jgi:Ca-activated chloride channel homolog
MTGSAATSKDVVTTTIGFGDDFDEELLLQMADAGRGDAHHAPTPEAAPGIFAKEFEDLVSLVAQNVSVEIRPATRCRSSPS